jgi:predicted DNA-binding transcriptional regulator AlpA
MLGNPRLLRPVAQQADTAAPAPLPTPAAATPQTPDPALLTPEAVARRLGVSSGVLQQWREKGTGPAFVRLTRKTLRYRVADVDGFIAGRICTSTAAP